MSKKQKIKMLLVISIVILVVLVTVLININKNNNTIDDRKKMEEFSKVYLEERVIPQGIYQFTQNYHGEIERETLYTKLNVVTKFISDLSKEVNDKNIEKFYNTNSKQIQSYLGLDNYEDFSKLIGKINEAKIKDTTFKHCAIEKGTFETQGNYTKFKIVFHYENETSLALQIFLINKSTAGKPVLKVLAE